MTVDTSEMMEFVRNDGTSSEMTVDTSEMMVHSSEMMELVRNDREPGHYDLVAPNLLTGQDLRSELSDWRVRTLS